jgi:hypothetical protein
MGPRMLIRPKSTSPEKSLLKYDLYLQKHKKVY